MNDIEKLMLQWDKNLERELAKEQRQDELDNAIGLIKKLEVEGLEANEIIYRCCEIHGLQQNIVAEVMGMSAANLCQRLDRYCRKHDKPRPEDRFEAKRWDDLHGLAGEIMDEEQHGVAFHEPGKTKIADENYKKFHKFGREISKNR